MTPSAGSVNSFLFAWAWRSWICCCSAAIDSTLPFAQNSPAPNVSTTTTTPTSAAIPHPMAIFPPVPKLCLLAFVTNAGC